MNLRCLIFGHLFIPTGRTSILGNPILICQRCQKTRTPR